MFAILFAIAACSGNAKGQRPAPTAAASMPTGAERWQGGALLLPAKSPAVFTGQLDQILDAAGRLKAWLVAEPAMLGPDGESIARTIESGWVAATTYLGVDPLELKAWTERGVDPRRRVFVGLYPVLDDGRRFVANVDNVLRSELGIAPGADVSGSLHQLAANEGTLTAGTNARIRRMLGETNPIGGVRVVIGVTSQQEFLTTASSFAEGLGFRPFPAAMTSGAHNFWSDSRTVPAMSIRFSGDHAILDLLFPAFRAGEPQGFDPNKDLGELHGQLTHALGRLPPGRPDAPAPPGEPAFSASFDQAAMAELTRLTNYWRALDAMQAMGTDRRDTLLLGALVEGVAEADAWTLSADELTGTSFAVDVAPREASVVGGVRMTMFGKRDLVTLDTSRSVPTLGLERRRMAFGMDLQEMRSEEWRSWFGGDTGRDFDALEFSSMRPLPTLLPGLRAGTLAASVFGDPVVASAISADLGQALREMTDVHRFEVIGLAPDTKDMGRVPEVLVAVVLPKDAQKEAVGRVQAVVSGALLGFADLAIEPPVSPPLTETSTAVVPHGSIAVQQRLVRSPNHLVVLFGIGVPDDVFTAELAGLTEARTVHGVAQGRLEPLALVSWLRDSDEALFEPIDADILAQRLGALTLRYGATKHDEANAVTLEVELGTPPQL